MNRRDFLKSTLTIAALAPFCRLAAQNGLDTVTGETLLRSLGQTGLRVSPISLGVEGFKDKSFAETKAILDYASANGVNFIDICIADPKMLDDMGKVIRPKRDRFVIQGHLCTVWENGQYRRTRNLAASQKAYAKMLEAFGGGDLLSENLSPFGKAFTPVQALNYALTRPAVAAVMVDCRNIDQIKAALAWNTATAAEKDYTRVFSGLDAKSWAGHCLYCGHCAPCPKKIDIANVNKYLNLAVAQGEVPATVRDHYKLLKAHASDCVQCGACEKRCPFQVPIREKMKQAVKVFGV